MAAQGPFRLEVVQVPQQGDNVAALRLEVAMQPLMAELGGDAIWPLRLQDADGQRYVSLCLF